MTQLFMVVSIPQLSGIHRIDLDMRTIDTYVGHMRRMCIRNEHSLW
jgi:hypothetical protein